jgi:hypothetical protein
MSEAKKLIKESEARWVDLRFTDTRGKEQHVSFPSKDVDDEFLQVGKMFDGSSIEGWKGINESDMILMPDDTTAVLDPFTDEPTVIIRCDIIEPSTMQSYDRDPRSVAKRAEGYLASTGLGDTAFFGPEPEFFVFDDVKWGSSINGCFHKVNSEEGVWSSEFTLWKHPFIEEPHLTSSKTKNSGSGPKKAVLPNPVDAKYPSARFATERGSRSYDCMVEGSMISQRIITVGSSVNGSKTAVVSSGIRIISDSLIPFHPSIEEPSNILPTWRNSSSTSFDGKETCCSLPLVSVKRRSTQRASLSLINFFASDISSSKFICT